MIMTKQQKLFDKIKNRPQDVRWSEFKKFMALEGCTMRKGKGTGRFFSRPDGVTITVDKPHGSAKVDTGAVKRALKVLGY